MRLIVPICLALAGRPAAAAEPPRPAAPVRATPGHFEPGGLWRGLPWGSTLERVLAAFPGESRALDRPVTLADGNVVAGAIPAYEIEGRTFVVRFVFTKGSLALVSMRTPEDQYAPPEFYEKLAKVLEERFGSKGEKTKDDNFVDLRETRWRLPSSQVDLKYIPGVVVILYSAPAQK
jgi:hypothetical protein